MAKNIKPNTYQSVFGLKKSKLREPSLGRGPMYQNLPHYCPTELFYVEPYRNKHVLHSMLMKGLRDKFDALQREEALQRCSINATCENQKLNIHSKVSPRRHKILSGECGHKYKQNPTTSVPYLELGDISQPKGKVVNEKGYTLGEDLEKTRPRNLVPNLFAGMNANFS